MHVAQDSTAGDLVSAAQKMSCKYLVGEKSGRLPAAGLDPGVEVGRAR